MPSSTRSSSATRDRSGPSTSSSWTPRPNPSPRRRTPGPRPRSPSRRPAPRRGSRTRSRPSRRGGSWRRSSARAGTRPRPRSCWGCRGGPSSGSSVNTPSSARGSARIDNVSGDGRGGGQTSAENLTAEPATASRGGALPEAVGGFKVVAPLEASVLGRTFRAVRETDGLPVILKLIELDDAALHARIALALEALSKVDHPSLARVVHHGESAGLHFYALAADDGVTLLDFVKRARPIDGAEVAWVGARLAAGLHALHERCLPHGDVTPVNISVASDGSVRIVDLGWTQRRR